MYGGRDNLGSPPEGNDDRIVEELEIQIGNDVVRIRDGEVLSAVNNAFEQEIDNIELPVDATEYGMPGT